MIFNDFKEKCPFLAKTLSKHLTYLKYIDTVGFFLKCYLSSTNKSISFHKHMPQYNTAEPLFTISH